MIFLKNFLKANKTPTFNRQLIYVDIYLHRIHTIRLSEGA